MKIRVLILALMAAGSAQAQPPEQPAPEGDAVENSEEAPLDPRLKIEALQSELEFLRAKLAEDEAELKRKEQMLRALLEQDLNSAPQPYSSAVANAISDLSDCQQQLMSGDVDGVEDRLARAQVVLRGSPAEAQVEAARGWLAVGNLGDARASLSHAITAANEAY